MPRSIYTKIRILLQQCADTPGLEIDALVTTVRDQELDAFKVFRNVDDRILEDYCQPATIRKTLYLVADLGLAVVDPACSLTSLGQGALADYDHVLGQAVIDHLSQVYGVGLETIRGVIADVKTRQQAEVSSAQEVHKELRERDAFRQKVSLERFATLMNILGRCGVLRWFIKKYYWI